MIDDDRAREHLRSEEDATATLVVAALLAAPPPVTPGGARTFWGDPAHRLGVTTPGRHGWWISGGPR